MPTLSIAVLAAFAITIVGQAIGLSLIPATRGFTAPVPTVVCIVCFVGSFGTFARLVRDGVQLSLLTPIVTLTLQIVVLVVATTIYHESASPPKIGLLLGAAAMITAATRF